MFGGCWHSGQSEEARGGWGWGVDGGRIGQRPQYKLKSSLKSVHIHINLKKTTKKHEQVKDTVKPVCCVQCYIVKLVWPCKLFSSPNRTENKLGQSKHICFAFPGKNIFQWSRDCVLTRIVHKFLSNVIIEGTSEQVLFVLYRIYTNYTISLDSTSTVAMKIVVNW